MHLLDAYWRIFTSIINSKVVFTFLFFSILFWVVSSSLFIFCISGIILFVFILVSGSSNIAHTYYRFLVSILFFLNDFFKFQFTILVLVFPTWCMSLLLFIFVFHFYFKLCLINFNFLLLYDLLCIILSPFSALSLCGCVYIRYNTYIYLSLLGLLFKKTPQTG